MRPLGVVATAAHHEQQVYDPGWDQVLLREGELLDQAHGTLESEEELRSEEEEEEIGRGDKTAGNEAGRTDSRFNSSRFA